MLGRLLLCRGCSGGGDGNDRICAENESPPPPGGRIGPQCKILDGVFDDARVSHGRLARRFSSPGTKETLGSENRKQ